MKHRSKTVASAAQKHGHLHLATSPTLPWPVSGLLTNNGFKMSAIRDLSESMPKSPSALVNPATSSITAWGTGLVLAVAGLLVTTSQASHAQVSSCQYDPSYGSYAFTGQQAGAQGFSCSVGDKTFSNFSGMAVREDLQFELYEAGSSHYVKITSTLFNPATLWDVAYDVSAAGPTIAELSTFAGSDFTGPDPLNLNASVTDLISATTASYSNGFGSQSSTPASFSPTVQNLSLRAVLEIEDNSQASADTWIQTIRQSRPAVPTPLPWLGAGAAFGFSRRIRRRILLG